MYLVHEIHFLHTYRNSSFKERDAFIGFQKDTPASVVFQASRLLQLACSEIEAGLPNAEEKWSEVMKWSQARTDDLITEENGTQRIREAPVSATT